MALWRSLDTRAVRRFSRGSLLYHMRLQQTRRGSDTSIPNERTFFRANCRDQAAQAARRRALQRYLYPVNDESYGKRRSDRGLPLLLGQFQPNIVACGSSGRLPTVSMGGDLCMNLIIGRFRGSGLTRDVLEENPNHQPTCTLAACRGGGG